MNARSRTRLRAEPTPTPSFTPIRTGYFQRKCACGGTPGLTGECAWCRKKRLQRCLARQTEPSTVPPIVNDVLRSPGQPLDANIRASMEPRFGHDFSRVRVHADTRAAESARAVNALAYTVGHDVVFAAGRYAPGTAEGTRLLAHELTHVVQQHVGGPTQPALSPSATLEHEAERVEDVLASGQHTIDVALGSDVGLARAPATENLSTLSDAELEAEYQRVQQWLLEHSMVEVDYGPTADYLEVIEQEVARRMDVGGLQTGGFTANTLIQTLDANVRINEYVKPAEQLAKKVFSDLQSGDPKLSHMEARVRASEGRNALLTATREKLTPGGKAFSEAIKEEGKPLADLVEKYARQVLAERPDLLEKYGLKTLDPKSPLFEAAKVRAALQEVGESAEVSEKIISAAGRTGKTVTAMAKFTKVAGPIGTVAGLGISTYEVIEAPEGQKLAVAGRETAGFAGGTLGSIGGGMLAGWTASLLCGPGAPVCAIIVSITVVGGASYAGGRAGEALYESFSGSLEEMGRIRMACIEACEQQPWYLRGFCLQGCGGT